MAFIDMPAEVLDCTAQIVSAHLSRNAVPLADVPDVIAKVYQALMDLNTAAAPPRPSAELTPAVPIKKSVYPDYIVCLEDGKKLKMLRRHLKTVYGMTPDQYRQRWGLPSNYPMVAPAYAERRSTLAKAIGLGNGRRREGMISARGGGPDADDDVMEPDDAVVDDMAADDDGIEDDGTEAMAPDDTAFEAAAPPPSVVADTEDAEDPESSDPDAREITAASVFANFPGAASDRSGGESKADKDPPADGAKPGRRKRFAQQSPRPMPTRSTSRR